MKNFLSLPLAALTVGCLTLLSDGTFADAGHVAPAASATNEVKVATTLPTLTAGVAELEFKEFFKTPVGPRGLEMTEKLRGLNGQRVRLKGYMVREHHVTRPGCFILSPEPVQLDEDEFGLCDDLPACATLIIVPSAGDKNVPHQFGRVVVSGTLNVGSREEKDGRVFLARLTLDETPATVR